MYLYVYKVEKKKFSENLEKENKFYKFILL